MSSAIANALAVKRLMRDRTSTFVQPGLRPAYPTWAEQTTCPELYEPTEDIQLTGTSWLINTKCGILGDKQGQGKTKMVYDAIDYLMSGTTSAGPDFDFINNALIICKAGSIDDTWIADYKFMSEGFAKLIDYRGTLKQRRKMLRQLGPDEEYYAYQNVVVIMSYAVFRQDYEGIAKLPWDLIVLDESPYIGGNDLNESMSQIGERIMALKHVPRKWLLSGTPMKKHAGTLWNQMRFLGFEQRSWAQFQEDLLVVQKVQIAPGTFRSKVTGVKSEAAIGQLNAMLACMLRRTDMSHLPPVMPTKHVQVPLSQANAKRYYELQQKLRWAEKNVDEKYTQPDQLKLQMRELCSNNKEKIDAAREIVDKAVENGDKVIIFTKHLSTLRELYRHFKSYGMAYIAGAITTSKRADGTSDRSEQVQKFQNDPECCVLIATTGASAEGLPLYAANHVIFIDRPDSKGDFDQALARPHRIGQTKPLFSYVLEAVWWAAGKVHTTIEHSVDVKYAREGRMLEQVGL